MHIKKAGICQAWNRSLELRIWQFVAAMAGRVGHRASQGFRIVRIEAASHGWRRAGMDIPYPPARSRASRRADAVEAAAIIGPLGTAEIGRAASEGVCPH